RPQARSARARSTLVVYELTEVDRTARELTKVDRTTGEFALIRGYRGFLRTHRGWGDGRHGDRDVPHGTVTEAWSSSRPCVAFPPTPPRPGRPGAATACPGRHETPGPSGRQLPEAPVRPRRTSDGRPAPEPRSSLGPPNGPRVDHRGRAL